MLLARPDVIELLNDHYIPVSVDSTLAEGNERWFSTFKAHFMQRHAFANGPSGWIITPDGRPYQCIDVQLLQHQPERGVAILRQAVAELGVSKRPWLPAFVPDTLRTLRPTDTALHIVARFMVDEALRSKDERVPLRLQLGPVPSNPAPVLPLPLLFRIRLLAPIDEWCVLSAEQRQQLLPPSGARTGQRYTVDPAVAATIYRHFCPPTFNAHLQGRVLKSELVGQVIRRGQETEVELRGAFSEEHCIWGGPDGNLAEGRVVGYLKIDGSTGSLRALQLTTDPGVYGDHAGFQVPFAATAELWERGADVVPPAVATR